MPDKYDFKKEWPKVKKQLVEFSQEALDLAKKGEAELLRISKKGKLAVDSTALGLKKEHLLLQIGKEYVRAKCPGPQPDRLRDLVTELKELDKEIRTVKSKITPKSKKRKTAKK